MVFFDGTGKKNKKIAFTAIIVLCALFVVSSVFALSARQTARRVFFFYGADGREYVEIRYMRNNAAVDAAERYVSELLLGAENAHFKFLFNPGTRARACFVRDKVLYLDLSGNALFPGDNTCSLRDGIALLEKNIFRNFDSITEVDLFIDGIKAFEKNE